MNDIITTNTAVTMSSLEISNLVEKRHDNVKRTIETLVTGSTIVQPQIEDEQTKDSVGRARTIQVYLLDKRSSYIVVAQLSPEFTARLVDRWQELEAKLAKPADPMQALNDPAAMRGLLLTYTERVLVLEDEKKALTPKAAALDRISTADGLTCITDTAKTLQVRPKDLFAILSRDKWIYRRPGGKGWIAYQDKIQQGLLTHKVTTVTDIHTGMDKVMERVLVTPKGLTKLTQSIGGAQQ